MKILHISDFHYKSKSFEKITEEGIVDKLCESLRKLRNKIDLIVFTGDLVYSGLKYEDFLEAREFFIDKILSSLDLTSKDFIICPGNHDVDRNFKLESLELLFDKNITDNKALDNFIIDGSKDFENSIQGLSNYTKFVSAFYEKTDKNEFYNIHKKKSDNAEIGIVTLNSAWRALDNDSAGKLLFPPKLLEEALSKIKNCDCKMILLHHPLFWFKEFNYSKIQEIIHKEFDVIFSGHIHESQLSAHYKYNNGIFAHVAPASLTYDKNYIGYSIIDYNPCVKEEASITNSKYVDEFGKFTDNEPIIISIPCGEEKQKQNKFRAKLNSKLNIELANASDLILSKKTDDSTGDEFLELFNNPIIKTKSKSDIKISDSSTKFDFKTLLKNEQNYILFGHDKSGKTSILKYLQIIHLKKYSNNGNIPFYIDFRELESKIDNNWTLIRHISRYFELTRRNTIDLINTHNFRLLVDNYEPNHVLAELINTFLLEYPKINCVICSDHLTSRIVDEYKIGNSNFIKLYLHDITRKEVRTYADKWFDHTVESKDEVLEKIVSFCKQLEMPMNYWTISILLMIHQKSRFDISKNLYEILDLCVDEILGKKYLSLTKSKINFKQLKSICGKLAKFLLKKNANYCVNYSEVLEELKKEVSSNIRLVANPREILEYLINSGVLKINANDEISFRLNGVFEYFIAYNMSQDDKFKNEIINDDKIYLSFKNELEIYSGLNNDSIQFLKTIYNKTSLYFSKSNNYYAELGCVDSLLEDSVSVKEHEKLKEIAKEIIAEEPLVDDKKDHLKDQFDPININSDIVPKKLYDITNINSEIYERYISILARIYKTMDEVNDGETLDEIFDFLLETYINFGHFLIKETEDELIVSEDSEDKSTTRNILEILNNFIPIITQVAFSDGIAHHNVEAIILNKIEKLRIEEKSNQYKLYVLYFLLMDIDEKNIEKYTDDLIGLVKIGILKYSVILKLNYYYAFNGHRSKKTANFLKDRIEKAQMSLNSKTDRSALQSSLDKQKKSNLLKEK